ncbi:uncharacterized domain 1-containing protein [Sporobacter termitidis DSM 10068]|uniref:Uncharacterized domain 1-containing protein n=1 Tax=Sporobacter termitidis DSM 10068 TaxID=1123282 RepID=A0A1M5YT74_9FIRM|nr:PaaI family thioesterase [Sporobacter termitidis]SHI15169.1 uncharacterized domain 1-containing protein [Sporobacter termitidis DSM 10068]
MEYLTSQESMENTFRGFCEKLPEERNGRINALCRPQFMDCDLENKTLRLRYEVQDWMLNVADILHGGVLATMFDLTMGLLSVYFSGGTMTPTTNMQISFLRPIPAGEALIVKAACDMSGRTLCAVRAEALPASKPDKPSATAAATFFTGGNAAKVMKTD